MWHLRASFGLVLVLAAAAPAPAADKPDADLSARIDAGVEAACRSEGIAPADPCDDATFLRRVWLDLAGRVPPGLAAREFLDDSAADKRARMVDKLLAGDDFADQWRRVLKQAARPQKSSRVQ